MIASCVRVDTGELGPRASDGLPGLADQSPRWYTSVSLRFPYLHLEAASGGGVSGGRRRAGLELIWDAEAMGMKGLGRIT